MPVVEPEYRFFEVHGKGMLCQTVELSQAMLGIAPEGLNPIDML